MSQLKFSVLAAIFILLATNLQASQSSGSTTDDPLAGQGSSSPSDDDPLVSPPTMEKPVAKPTVMRFSYNEDDPMGPQNWETLPGARDTTNYCGIRAVTPFDISVESAQAIVPAEEQKQKEKDGGGGHGPQDEDELDELTNKTPELSLMFTVSPKAQRQSWYLTQPEDIYHGLEIRGTDTLTQLTVSDQFDSHLGHAGERSKAETYTINFALLTYCDKPPPKGRSSHQLDGEIFHFEIHLLFFKDLRAFGIDNYLNSVRPESFVMVSILGKVDKKNDTDNKHFEPIAQAARKYVGESMDDYVDKKEEIMKWDLHWLIPMDSGYFYYNNGTFPIPPCFPIPRVYVIKEPIQISKKQLKAFTSFKTKSEASGRMPCTFGKLRHEITKSEVYFNRNPVQVINSDIHQKKDEKSGGVWSSRNSKLVFGVIGTILVTIRGY